MSDNGNIIEEDHNPNERYYDYMGRRLREENAKVRQANAKSNAKKWIWVTFQKEGIHKYPAALEDPKLATGDWDDVSFLGYPHGHIFHFRVSIEVFHDDRDIEFIQFKRWLERLFSQHSTTEHEMLVLDYKSCEMIADELYDHISKKHPGRSVKIQVSEDGENGCDIEYMYE